MFLLSECKAPEKNDEVYLGCVVTGSGPLSIAWETKAQKIREHVFFPTKIKNSNNYTMSLYVSVRASELSLPHKCVINMTPKGKEKTFKLPGEYPWTM